MRETSRAGIAPSPLTVFVSVWLLGFAPFPAACQASHNGAPERVALGRRILFRPQLLRQSKVCFVIAGDIVAGDFFEGLQKIETPQGIEFQKASRTITAYPDLLLATVEARRMRCNPTPQAIEIPPELSDLPGSLKFAAQWESGGRLRPAESRLLDTYHEVWTESTPPTWSFLYAVFAKDVPLTDQLRLSVDAGNGVLLGRLIADLQNQPRNQFAGLFSIVVPGACPGFPYVSNHPSKIKLDKKSAEALQRSVNAGQETWRLRPEPVAAWEILKRDLTLPPPAGTPENAFGLSLEKKIDKKDVGVLVYGPSLEKPGYRITVKRPRWLYKLAPSPDSVIWVATDVKVISCVSPLSLPYLLYPQAGLEVRPE